MITTAMTIEMSMNNDKNSNAIKIYSATKQMANSTAYLTYKMLSGLQSSSINAMAHVVNKLTTECQKRKH